MGHRLHPRRLVDLEDLKTTCDKGIIATIPAVRSSISAVSKTHSKISSARSLGTMMLGISSLGHRRAGARWRARTGPHRERVDVRCVRAFSSRSALTTSKPCPLGIAWIIFCSIAYYARAQADRARASPPSQPVAHRRSPSRGVELAGFVDPLGSVDLIVAPEDVDDLLHLDDEIRSRAGRTRGAASVVDGCAACARRSGGRSRRPCLAGRRW